MSQKPPEIEAALPALETLSSEIPGDDFKKLKKALPALARQMVQLGEDVNVDMLIAHVKQGSQHLAKLRERYNQKPKAAKLSYHDVLKRLSMSQDDLNAKLQESIENQNINGVVEWIEKGAEVTPRTFASACEGSLKIVSQLHNYLDTSEDYVLRNALSSATRAENFDIANWLLSKGANIEGMFYSNFSYWEGETKKFVVQTGIDFVHERLDEFLGSPIRLYDLDECAFFIEECGVNPKFLSDDLYKSYRNLLAWKELYPDYEDRTQIRHYPPYHCDNEVLKPVWKMLQEEGCGNSDSLVYAYHAASLFRSEQRVLQYLLKWGETGKQPLHDIIQDIQIPKSGRPDLKAWGDAVLKHGPKMSRYVKFSDRLKQPLKDGSGGWSYAKTKAEIAKYAYSRGQENPVLANFCLEHAWDDDDFEDALKQIEKFKKEYNPSALKDAANDNIKGGAIPDITINGTKFGKDGYTFKKLPDGDVRGLLLGEFTDCCQHLASTNGDECAKHGFLSENSGFYIIEDCDTGNIVAQTWAWRGKQGEIVFDSLESLKGHFDKEKWTSLCAEFSEKLKKTIQDSGITAFYVGKGGATPEKMRFGKADQTAKPLDYQGYRDSKKQYLVATY